MHHVFGYYIFDTRKFRWLARQWESFRVGVHVLTPRFYLGPFVIARKRK